MDKEQLIYESLGMPKNVISYHMSRNLAILFPEMALIEGEEDFFEVEEFAKAGFCTINYRAVVHNQMDTYWLAPDITSKYWVEADVKAVPDQEEVEQQVFERSKNVWLEVHWDNSIFNVVIMTWRQGYGMTRYYWILAESSLRARQLFVKV